MYSKLLMFAMVDTDWVQGKPTLFQNSKREEDLQKMLGNVHK